MLLIDGHNLIGQLSAPRLDDPDDEEQLLCRLRGYRASSGESMVVYFDAGETYFASPRRSEPGITVRNASIGQPADALIVQDIQRHPRPGDLTVVTSDREVQQVANNHGCRVIDSVTFAAELEHPRRRLARRRPRAKASAEPRLSSQEIEEWLQVFDQPRRRRCSGTERDGR
jgi:predicted RNA-binding protein with PIN domain